MTEKPEKTEFLFLAGHPCLDFLNTRTVAKGQAVELLPTLDEFLRWLTRAGRIDARGAAEALKRWNDGPEGARITERARAFRETLRHMTDAIVRSRSASTEGVAAINFILAENDGNLRLERQGAGFRTRFAARPTSPITLLGVVAEAAADLLSRGDLHLVRRCGNPECVLYFYDTTRNHRRQWCAMGTCGNLMKVRAFRKRHRKGRAAT
ncbi:MAG TPA: ABATE domain-containing protein [Thermoanaerobaculia bacterium]|jgi:predicted RNA-binding Zn ribbon-like protein|nr:ABATE domain-containing protein [Thermoanaerobaculia bacterium]